MRLWAHQTAILRVWQQLRTGEDAVRFRGELEVEMRAEEAHRLALEVEATGAREAFYRAYVSGQRTDPLHSSSFFPPQATTQVLVEQALLPGLRARRVLAEVAQLALRGAASESGVPRAGDGSLHPGSGLAAFVAAAAVAGAPRRTFARPPRPPFDCGAPWLRHPHPTPESIPGPLLMQGYQCRPGRRGTRSFNKRS